RVGRPPGVARARADDEAGAVSRDVQPHGPAGARGARRVRVRRISPGRPACRPGGLRAAAARRGGVAAVRPRLAREDAMTVGELRALAEAVAREAGALLRGAFDGPELRVSSKSTPTDLVSEADHAAEKLIRERIAAARPGDGVLGEEGGDHAGTSGVRWVV